MKKNDRDEFLNIIKDIVNSKEFQKRKNFKHHDDSVYEHSIRVSNMAYKIAKKMPKFFKVSVVDATVAGLLHDFYTTPWREYKAKGFFNQHAFQHGRIASENAVKYFPNLMNKKIINSIKCHMFPLYFPPRYKEGWIVTLADKIVSLEIFKSPKELPRYIGLKKKKGDKNE